MKHPFHQTQIWQKESSSIELSTTIFPQLLFLAHSLTHNCIPFGLHFSFTPPSFPHGYFPSALLFTYGLSYITSYFSLVLFNTPFNTYLHFVVCIVVLSLLPFHSFRHSFIYSQFEKSFNPWYEFNWMCCQHTYMIVFHSIWFAGRNTKFLYSENYLCRCGEAKMEHDDNSNNNNNNNHVKGGRMQQQQWNKKKMELDFEHYKLIFKLYEMILSVQCDVWAEAAIDKSHTVSKAVICCCYCRSTSNNAHIDSVPSTHTHGSTPNTK